ncbi:hypothetical protein [Turicibacter sanguinis]|uniref:hypothetical protein n=1 Tax=Turicibacter sanguinis TaxID=154288 RepID=UPI00241FC3F8|nr:hypothetical protein [Turicibacter sanguinis]
MEELFEHIGYVRVKNRKIPVPHSYRIMYKVTQILMIIKICCSPRKGCSIEKLQIISNAISSEKTFMDLKNFVEGNSTFIPIRFDPSVNRAVSYAVSEELIVIQKNKLLKLTDKGKEYVESVNSDKNVYKYEKDKMSNIGYSLTEDEITQIISKWRF